MNDQNVKRKLAAIISADVEGYSRLMGEDEIRSNKCSYRAASGAGGGCSRR
jgi:hypothetical protein